MSSQPPVAAAPIKLTPGELPLTLTVDVLRLPYPLATRVVLAEIVSLYAATGNCYCSDAHLAARLTLSPNTVSRAVQQLEAAGFVEKHVNKAAGNHRLLVPVPASIKAAAATNPYPQNEGRNPTPKTVLPYPQNEGSPTPKTGDTLPPIWGTNTTVNSTENLQEISTPNEPEKKIGAGEFSEDSTPSLTAEVQLVPPVAEPPHAAESRPVVATELPAALLVDVRALADEMGKMWGFSEMHGFPGWNRLYTFAKHQAQQGRLAALRQQLAGYQAGHMRPGVRAHKLADWLGNPQHAQGPYTDGVWCSCDWPTIANQVQARPGQPVPAPARATSSPSKAKANWR